MYQGDLKNNFLATGVGSLPYIEADRAANFIFDSFDSDIPFWPQLPRRTFFENMYVQFCEKFPGVVIDEKGKNIKIDTTKLSYISELEECLNKLETPDTDYFSISSKYAQGLYELKDKVKALGGDGWVKAQLIGPLSWGLSLLDEANNPILYNAELGELLSLFLCAKAAWLIKFLQVTQKTKIIIFIDEPYLVAVGTSQCGLSRKDVIEKINKLVCAIHGCGALAGLHCCGNTDWDMVMATDIDILNFDAFGYLDKILLYSDSLQAFLKRGGLPAIGIVPTDNEALASASTDTLFSILTKEKRLLKNGALITTSCGCSGLSAELSEKANKLCVELASKLRKEF
jgi:hypothetical protein